MTKRRYPMILILLASLLMAHCSGTEEEKHDQDTSNNQDILNNEVTAKMEVTDMSSEEDMTTSQEESNEIVLVDMKGEQTGEEVMQEDSIQVDFLHEDSEHSDSMTEESKVEEMITAETIEEMIRPRAAKKGLKLNIECAPGVPEVIKADEAKMQQVLINLLDNAVKYTESGGITLRISCQSSVVNHQ